jgi:hypothetical protein
MFSKNKRMRKIMKNVTKFLMVAFIIGAFCTMTFAQTDEKPVGSVKGAVIKGGSNPKPPGNQKTSEAKNTLTFCWSSDENTSPKYRLKVWQLMQGQNAETAMRTNKPIVTKDVADITEPSTTAKHAIKTKGMGGDRSSTAGSNSDVIKACSEALQQQNDSGKYINSNLAGNNTYNGQAYKTTDTSSAVIVRAVTVDDYPVCAEGSSCDYAATVEAVNAAGNPMPNAKPIRGYKFGFNREKGFYFEILH